MIGSWSGFQQIIIFLKKNHLACLCSTIPFHLYIGVKYCAEIKAWRKPTFCLHPSPVGYTKLGVHSEYFCQLKLVKYVCFLCASKSSELMPALYAFSDKLCNKETTKLYLPITLLTLHEI